MSKEDKSGFDILDDFINYRFSEIEKGERETNPGAFLLSEKECKLLDKVALCMTRASAPYLEAYEQSKSPELMQTIINETFKAFEVDKIKIENLRALTDKIKNNLFWSMTPQISKGAKEKKFNVKYSIAYKTTAESPDNTNLELDENHPFFKAETMQERARALGLSDKYLYVSSFDFNILETLSYTFALYDAEREQAQEVITITPPPNDAFYRLVSSKPMKALNIGANAKAPKISKKRNEQGHQISIAEYLSSAGIEILFTDFSPYAAGGFITVGDPNTDKLLQQAQIITALTGKQQIEISMKEFKEFRELKDAKAAIETAKTACNRLRRAGSDIDISDPIASLSGGWNYVQKAFVAQTGNKGKNKIIIEWTNDIYRHITENIKAGQQIEQIDKSIFTIPDKQAPAYNIACKFSWHLRLNAGKANDHRLSVQTLINCVPTWPLYTENIKDIPDADKANYIKYPSQAPDRIIKPFIETLNYLTNDKKIFKSYKFIGKNNHGLTDAELSEARKDYKYFVTLLVEVEFTNEPNYANLKEHKAKQKELAEKAAARKAPKKKNK